MIGLEMTEGAADCARLCQEEGRLSTALGEKYCVFASLIITEEHVDAAIRILQNVLTDCHKGGPSVPRMEGINKILVIGSGPIVIGQAAEFDYAGTQACKALHEEGCEIVLVNSNPATTMTDPDIADRVYLEPLSLDYLTG